MAETKNIAKQGTLTGRRAFLGTLGAVTALPMFPALAEQAGPGRWAEASSFHLAALQAAYQAEIARLAATLRPRFESGELRAWREGDDEWDTETGEGRVPGTESPQWEVDRICAKHFGIEVTRQDHGDVETFEGDEAMASLMLAASPHTGATGDGEVYVCDHAREAAGWDVIAYARAAGWYTPTLDECEDPVISKAECPKCGHMAFQHGDGVDDKAGCGDTRCKHGCPMRHARHVPGFVS